MKTYSLWMPFCLIIFLLGSCSGNENKPHSTFPASGEMADTTSAGADVREKVAADIADNLGKKDYAAARKDFAKIMLDGLPEDKMKDVWESALKQFGAYQSVTSTTKVIKGGYKVIKKRCKFENESATIQVAFNEENQVVGLFLLP